MDVGPTILKSAMTTMTMMSLRTMALMLVSSTTVLPIPAMSTPMLTTTATIPSQPKLVITIHPVLGTIPLAGTNLQFQLHLPNYVAKLCFFLRGQSAPSNYAGNAMLSSPY
uniref:Uncharacterized protein n=1 Tax=Romanomermis culicivorax TaxID=13658 RepID=A0A915I6B7_ROMCU